GPMELPESRSAGNRRLRVRTLSKPVTRPRRQPGPASSARLLESPGDSRVRLGRGRGWPDPKEELQVLRDTLTVRLRRTPGAEPPLGRIPQGRGIAGYRNARFRACQGSGAQDRSAPPRCQERACVGQYTVSCAVPRAGPMDPLTRRGVA